MSGFTAIVTAIIVGLGSNLDNCGVGMAYGSRGIRLPHRLNAVINAVGFCAAFLGASIGEVIGRSLPFEAAAWTACVVFCAIGLSFWYSAYLHPWTGARTPVLKTPTPSPGVKQGILLGLALSFTNVATGFGTTVSNAAELWTTVLSITVWGYLMIWFGNIVGIGILARFLGKYAAFVGGLLLILVGAHQVVG